jgi:predicted enzyme related to lactoylglutathione lyase
MTPIRLAALVVSLGYLGLRGLAADLKETAIPNVGAGRVAWFDLTTTNLSVSKAFYGKLLGWEFAPVAGTDLAVEIVSRHQSIGTLRVSEGRLSPYNGVVYVQVSKLPACCRTVRQLGGTVVPGFPFDLPGGRGAIAVLTDPTGHPIGLYSRESLPKQK